MTTCWITFSPYIFGLEENLALLRNRMAVLKDLSQEVRTRVAREEITQQMKRTERVNDWLQRVEVLERQVEVILQNNSQDLERQEEVIPKNNSQGLERQEEVIPQNNSQELLKKCLLNYFPRN